MTSKRHMRRGRWITAIGAVVAIAATGTVVVATAGGSTSSRSPVMAGPTATVTSRDLVQTDDQPGTLGYTDTRDVYNQLTGTVTWVPASGAVIHRPRRIWRFEVIADHLPVALLGNRWAQACWACWNWGEALLIDAAAAGLIRPSGPGSGTGIP